MNKNKPLLKKHSIGRKIKKLRLKLRISQDRLSKMADVALNTVVKIESDPNQNPTLGTLEKFARALGVSVAQLIGA